MNWPHVVRPQLHDRSVFADLRVGSLLHLRSSILCWGAGFCVFVSTAGAQFPAPDFRGLPPVTTVGTGTAPAIASKEIASQAAQTARADLSLGTIRQESISNTSPESDARASSLAHYAAALQLESGGKLREALGHYISAVRADPSNAKLASYAAELSLNFNGRPAAIHLLEDCAKANPKSPEATLNLATFLTTYPPDDPFEKDHAQEVLEKAVKQFPAEPGIYRAAVMHHLTRQERPAAIQLLEQAYKQVVNQPDYWLAMGRLAQEVWPLSQPERNQQYRDQVNRYFIVATKAAPLPDREDVHLAVARYYLLSNQLPEATRIAEAVAKVSTKHDARKLLVSLYQAEGKEDAAIQLLEDLAKAEPDSVEIRRALTTIYEDKKRFADSVPHREAIIRIAGGGLQDYLQLGAILLDARMPEKALDFLKKRALPQFPDNPQFCYFATIANRVLRRYEDALKFYERTATLSQAVAPQLLNSSFYQGWGDTLQSVKRYEDAAQKYQKSISLIQQDDPTQAAVVLNNLGYMWLEQGKNLDQAGDFIRKAIKFAPDSPVYLDSLGWYHFLKGDYKEALKVLLEVEAKIGTVEAQDAEILDHIAQAYEKLGENAKALDYYRKAALLAPTNEEIHSRYKKANGGKTEPAATRDAPSAEKN